MQLAEMPTVHATNKRYVDLYALSGEPSALRRASLDARPESVRFSIINMIIK